MSKTFARTWQGIALAALLAIPSTLLGQQWPIIGSPVFAILFGLLLAPLFQKQGPLALYEARVTPGLQFTGKKVLQTAVVLLGFGLNFKEIMRVGQASLGIILATISTSLILSALLYRLLKLNADSAILIGVGSSICGGSAIAATAPVIRAKEEAIAQAMSVIFFFNVLAALIFPSLGGLLGMSTEGFGLFAGTAVNDTSSVTAAASAWDAVHPAALSSGNALQTATIVKLTRTLAIIPITLALAFFKERQALKAQTAQENRISEQGHEASASIKNHTGHLQTILRIFPFFLLWFLLAALITTLFDLPGTWISWARHLSKFFIVMAMAAIGLRTNVIHLIRSGAKPLLQGLLCWITITLVSLCLQALQGLW